MRYYKKITIWEANRRLRMLEHFADLLTKYFSNVKYNGFISSRPVENQEAHQARVDINLILDEVHLIILCAGVNPSLTVTPPPAIGGYVQRIDVVMNFHNLAHYQIPPKMVLDFVIRASGIYSRELRRALIRTFNPLFWIGCAFDCVARLPFVFLGKIGFNQKKAEASLIGRLLKSGLYLVTFFASLFTVLHFLGYLEPVKNLLRDLIDKLR